MLNPDYFLEQLNISVNKEDSVEAQILQMTRGFGVQPSYEGDKPYIFISYAHKDSALVLPAIRIIQDQGYPVWYDAGIRPGSIWTDDIANHIENATLVISFISGNAIDSPHCKAEISHAFNNRKPMLSVRLDQSKLPSGMEMQLSQSQMFPAFLENEDSYLAKLVDQSFIEETAGAALRKYQEEKRRAAEEAARKKRAAEEAEAAERRRKEAEEAERRRKEAEEIKRRRREAEEERRRRREAAQAELKRLDDEEAEAKRLEAEEERRKVESEKKYREQQAAAGKYHDVLQELALEKEARQKAEAEQKRLQEALEAAEDQFASMRACMVDMEENLDKAKVTEKHLRKTVNEERQRRKAAENDLNHLSEDNADKRAASMALASTYDKIKENLLRQTRSGYNAAIYTYNCGRESCLPMDFATKDALADVKSYICDMIYHDARVFERKKKKRMAYALYDALPDTFLDAEARKNTLRHRWVIRNVAWCILIVLMCLAVNCNLMQFAYDREASFWFKTLISVGPMIAAASLYSVTSLGWKWWNDADSLDAVCWIFVACAVICMVVDPFLYPSMPVWLRIVTSLGFNLLAFVLAFFVMVFWFLYVETKAGEYLYIQPFKD